MKKYYYPEERIAVVSMGGVFPDARDISEFWRNILAQKVSIKELPESIVNTKLYYRPEFFKQINKQDKTYTKMGSMIDLEPVLSVAKKFRIPPAVAEYMDPAQHGAIYCVDQALRTMKGRELPRERTAVILSGGNPAEFNERAIERNFYTLLEDHLRKNRIILDKLDAGELEELLREISTAALKETMPFTEDTTTGFLPNLIPGRVSNVFDLRGPSFLVDAACASVLTSTIIGTRGLLNKEYDAAIVGGIDFGLNAARLALFSAINALSPDGSFPFDVRANGFVMGQGAGVLVLKRLEDALRDGNEIIALISGYGQGSDGKGKYIAAPNEDGQARVIQEACQMAGYSAETIELIEAHGTGTAVGDVVEVNALKKAFSILQVNRANYCGIGSVKSNIGHLKAAAGAPGLIKAALALHHKILPPTANVRQINPKLQLENSPFYILTEKKDWIRQEEHPRRANVSAFGFGGADYHIAMEEYRPEFYRKVYAAPAINESGMSLVSTDERQNTGKILFLSGENMADISEAYNSFHEGADRQSFTHHVFQHNARASAQEKVRLALYASSYDELAKKWGFFQAQEKAGRLGEKEALALHGIYYGDGAPVTTAETALLFPGQASQYPNMCQELPATFPVVQSFYTQVDALWQACYGHTVSSLIFGREEETIEGNLQETKYTHPAMFLSSAGIFKLLSESGLKADYFIGHSLGEMTALYAGGMLDLAAAIRLIGARGYSFDAIPEKDRGKMISINAGEEETKELLAESGLEIHVANLNAPTQTVVGGADGEIEQLARYLEEKQVRHKVLNVSHAFHTPLIADAAQTFYNKIVDLRYQSFNAKIIANHRQEAYPKTQRGLKKMPQLLKEQITSSVRFVESIRLLYKEGVRAFVEVGPSAVLSDLVRQILPDQEIRVITTCPKRKNAVESYYRACGELFSLGIPLCVAPAKTDFATALTTPVETDPVVITGESCRTKPDAAPSLQENLVFSGVSVGLPGSFKKVFADRNWEDLFAGHNYIEILTEDDLTQMLDLNITRLVKNEEENPVFKRLSTVNELIRLAAKFGELDMSGDYLLDEETLRLMTSSVRAGVAAGYEALKDAGIPLVREWITTASGAKIPGRLLLPPEMREDTGVIFANCFAMVEPFIREVSTYVANRYGRRTKRELREFYESLIMNVSDEETKKLLTDWFTLNYSRLNLGDTDVYEFNRDFIIEYTSLANNRLAQLIGASGPNFHLNAACSSTAYAVTVAESLIRTGQAARVIVVGAENPTGKTVLPWIGASFLTSGAATTSADLYTAALPFDNRRNGMILGAGAVGIVLEKEADVEARGMKGICRLLGSHAFNMAGHQSRIDSGKFSMELERFISKMERVHGIRRREIAGKTVYFSHETYTPKRGGCSQTEKIALQTVFGQDYREILVTNTKGMTGHTIGASIEEAVAAKALQLQKTPPIVNYKEPDPELAGLRLSKGGDYSFEYVLRMVAGFGGQGNYILTQKVASKEDRAGERVVDSGKYQSWLARITSSPKARLEQVGRILVALGDEADAASLQAGEVSLKGRDLDSTLLSSAEDHGRLVSSGADQDSLVDQVLDLYAQVTKYPKEMLDLKMEMEADLGIDTVKQATIFALLAEKFHLEEEGELQLSKYPTIGDVVALVLTKAGISQNQSEAAVSVSLAEQELAYDGEGRAGQEIEQSVIRTISEVTKYPPEMLELDMEMESDLGIDTVKQATILSQLTEEFGLSGGEPPQLSTVLTIGDLIAAIKSRIGEAPTKGGFIPKGKSTPPPTTQREQGQVFAKENHVTKEQIGSDERRWNNEAEEAVLEIIAEVTKYPVEMLEPDMEMEADLGIDTVKQATIFSILGERFGVSQDRAVGISEYKTIGAVMEFARRLKSPDLPSASPLSQTNIEPPGKTSNLKVAAGSTGAEDQVMGLCYQRPVAVEADLPPKETSLKGKNVLVIGNNFAGVDKLATIVAAEAKQLETIVFPDPPTREEISARLEKVSMEPIEMLIDGGDLGHPFEKELSLADEEGLLRMNSEARFIFYQEFQRRFVQKLRIVCLVSLDGEMGYAESSKKLINPYSGALSGFYKGLRKEWPDSTVKILDLNISAIEELDRKAANRMIAEIESGGEDFEIAYSGATRRVIKLVDLDEGDLNPVGLPEEPHILITGGGNGISAEAAVGLAAQIKGKYTLLGRTVLPANIQELSAMNEAQLEQVRGEIQARLKATGKRVTPVLVQKEFGKITKAISVCKTIQRIKETGSKVQYFTCDVTDGTKLQAVMEQAVKEFGPVIGLIHGAGVEKSHLLADKSLDEFKQVFSVKALGLCYLYRALDPACLKVVMGFASISGRFGNEAQLDYSAANNFLGSYIRMMKARHPHLHSVSIDWSGWKDLGMAWRNEFVKLYGEEVGVHLIEPARGVQACHRLFTHETEGCELVVSRGLKGFAEPSAFVDNLWETPMIDWVTRKNGMIEQVSKIISVKKDPIIDHHRLGRTPLVPAVALMEIGAEYHRLLFDQHARYCFKDLSFTHPLKLFHDRAQELCVQARSEPNPKHLELVFKSSFIPKGGVPRLTTHCQFAIGDQPGDGAEMLKYTDLLQEELTAILFRETGNNQRWQFRNNLNFGPLFIDDHGYANNRIGYNETGLVYYYYVPREQLENKDYHLEQLLVNPCTMDTLFQAAAVHSLTQHDRIHLPVGVEEVGVLRVPRQIECLQIIAHLNRYENEVGFYDTIMLDSKGNLCYYMKNVAVHSISL